MNIQCVSLFPRSFPSNESEVAANAIARLWPWRRWLAALAMIGTVWLTTDSQVAFGGSFQTDLSAPDNNDSQTTILFFDDQRLNFIEGMTRKIGRPERIEESIYRDPNLQTAWAYPTVFFDADTRRWRMCYLGSVLQPKLFRLAAIAESEDGLHWSPRDTTAEAPLDDRVIPNQILPRKDFEEWSGCYLDPHALPAERFKGLVVYSGEKHRRDTSLWVSPDGIRWKIKEGVRWSDGGPDPASCVFWNDVRKRYVITTRPLFTDRRIALVETADWNQFTDPELAIQSDALDLPLTEPYGMPLVHYHGYYIGLLWLYHTPLAIKPMCGHKYYGGKVDCQLAYSLNGWHWQRGLRDLFIPNGPAGSPDSGCVYPTSVITLPDGSLRIYASATTEEHGSRSPGAGVILSYRLRKDGFVYLEAGDSPGRFGTRHLYWRGGEAKINVVCSNGGIVRTQITDTRGDPLPGYRFEDCIPGHDDNIAWTPTWANNRTLAELAGKMIRIEIELTRGRIYSLSGNFVPTVFAEYLRLRDNHESPTLRPGF